jgi:hypothetical protein
VTKQTLICIKERTTSDQSCTTQIGQAFEQASDGKDSNGVEGKKNSQDTSCPTRSNMLRKKSAGEESASEGESADGDSKG